MNNIKTIVVIVELENGNAHQVLASKEQKQIALQMLTDDNKQLRLTEELEPVEFKFKKLC